VILDYEEYIGLYAGAIKADKSISFSAPVPVTELSRSAGSLISSKYG